MGHRACLSTDTHWPFKKFSDSFWVLCKRKWPGVSIAVTQVPKTEKSASCWMQRYTPDSSAQLEKLYNLRHKKASFCSLKFVEIATWGIGLIPQESAFPGMNFAPLRSGPVILGYHLKYC